MTNLKFIFFGTSRFAEIILKKLKEYSFVPTLIVTGEDKPQGRGLVITSPPVKLWAEKNTVPFLQPHKLDQEFIEKLKTENWDFFILASYGRIIPQEILSLPRKGILNVHPSLLPKLRGPSPIQSAILHENETGVSIILLDKEIDHGPVLAHKKIHPPADGWPPYFSELERALAEEGGRLIAEVVPKWLAGEIEAKAQDHSLATFTKKISKDDAFINLDDLPETNLRKIRAYSDSPVAYTEIQTKKGKTRIKIRRAKIENDFLMLESVVPEGSKEMRWEDFSRGFL